MALKGKTNNKKFKKKDHSLRQSFGYAFEGFGYALSTVRNLKIHLLFTVLVILAGMFFGITTIEYIICLLCIALVISLELVNTAIEEAVDIASPEINPIAKRSKDVAASAVLFAAIMSAVIGAIIFVPKLLMLFRG